MLKQDKARFERMPFGPADAIAERHLADPLARNAGADIGLVLMVVGLVLGQGR
jgi:hypothetical protein